MIFILSHPLTLSGSSLGSCLIHRIHFLPLPTPVWAEGLQVGPHLDNLSGVSVPLGLSPGLARGSCHWTDLLVTNTTCLDSSLLCPTCLSTMTPFPIHMYTPQSPTPHVYPRPSDDHTVSAALDCVSLSLQLGPRPRDPDQRAVAQLQLRSCAQSWGCWGAGEAADSSGTPGPRKEPYLPPGTGTLMGPAAAVPAHTQNGHPHGSNDKGGSWRTHAIEVPCPSSPEPG